MLCLFLLLAQTSAFMLPHVETHIQNNTGVPKKKELLESFLSEPKKFVEEATNLDPVALGVIISWLDELLQDSHDTEKELEDTLAGKEQDVVDLAIALADADGAVKKATGDLEDANDDVIVKEKIVEEKEKIVEEKEALEVAAKGAHDAQIEVAKDAQDYHDKQIPSLDNEQSVLVDVIEMLSKITSGVVDLALGKDVTMSGVGFGGVGSLAVDGNSGGGNFASGHCAHTTDGDSWIVVDLGHTYDVTKMILTGRLNQCSNCVAQSSGWTIKVGDSPSGNPICKANFDLSGGDQVSLNCDNREHGHMPGRYVEMTSSQAMVLCEIEVHGDVFGQVNWVHCANEGEKCYCDGTIRYGADDVWSEHSNTGMVHCGNDSFGDPAKGVHKSCECDS